MKISISGPSQSHSTRFIQVTVLLQESLPHAFASFSCLGTNSRRVNVSAFYSSHQIPAVGWLSKKWPTKSAVNTRCWSFKSVFKSVITTAQENWLKHPCQSRVLEDSTSSTEVLFGRILDSTIFWVIFISQLLTLPSSYELSLDKSIAWCLLKKKGNLRMKPSL